MTVKTLQQAIRNKCLDCSNQQPKEIRLCTVKECALLPYRMGRRKVGLVEIAPIFQKTDLLAGKKI